VSGGLTWRPRQVGLGGRLAWAVRRLGGAAAAWPRAARQRLGYAAGTVVAASNTISAISQPGRITDSIDQSS
jgi:hypothetical protein